MKFGRRFVEGIHTFFDGNGLLRRFGPPSRSAAVLMYHRVNDYDGDGLTTPTGVFDQMMRELKKRYHIVSLANLVRDVQNGVSPSNKVAITFDDGYRDNLLCAAPILQEHGIPATFFVTSGFIGTRRVFPWDMNNAVQNELMDWSDVRSLSQMGFEIGAHTVNHLDLGLVSSDVARLEIRNSKTAIQEAIGKEIKAFAFPFGKRSSCPESVSKIVAEEGFSCCCVGFGGKVSPKSDIFRLNRVPMYPTCRDLLMDVEGVLTYFDGASRFAGIPVVQHNVEQW